MSVFRVGDKVRLKLARTRKDIVKTVIGVHDSGRLTVSDGGTGGRIVVRARDVEPLHSDDIPEALGLFGQEYSLIDAASAVMEDVVSEMGYRVVSCSVDSEVIYAHLDAFPHECLMVIHEDRLRESSQTLEETIKRLVSDRIRMLEDVPF